MPELPEVQTIINGLQQTIISKTITGVWTDWPKYFKLPKNENEFRKLVQNKNIESIERKGKNILIHLQKNTTILIHQKISGHLLVGKWLSKENKNYQKIATGLKEEWQNQKWLPEEPKSFLTDPKNRFIHLMFFLSGGLMLALSDLRKFAKIIVGTKEKILNLPDIKNLGPNPLEPKFTLQKFLKLLRNKKGIVKKVLMNQNIISGIGNIYSDETLWLAKVHPLSKTEQLNQNQLKEIFLAIKTILKKAVKFRGTSIDDYRDTLGKKGKYEQKLFVYQKENNPCKRCGTKIRRIKINNRSTHFCPKCQKQKEIANSFVKS